jgi:hypothetical protein
MVAANACRLFEENEKRPQFQRPLHNVVTAPWLAVVHNERVNEGSLTQLLNYLTAGLLCVFAGVVALMAVVPV